MSHRVDIRLYVQREQNVLVTNGNFVVFVSLQAGEWSNFGKCMFLNKSHQF